MQALTNPTKKTAAGMVKHPLLNDVCKTTFIITAVFFLFQQSFAQTNYGITAGAGKTALYKFPFGPEDYDRYSSAGSFWGGITADIPLNKNGINLFTSAIYKNRGYKYAMQNATGANNTKKDSAYTQKINYVDINLTLLKKFNMGGGNSFFAGTGPSASIFTAGKEDIQVNYFGTAVPPVNYTKTKLTAGSVPGTYKPMFISWNFVAGFQLDKFNVWLNAGIPLSDYYQDAANAVKHKLKTFGINAGYTLFSSDKEKKYKRKDKKDQRKEDRADRKLPVAVVVIDSLGDADGDGIINKDDKCPGHKGVAKYNGCPVPDTDGDGITDDADKCPLVSGPLTNSGCPLFSDTLKTEPQGDTILYTIYFEPAKSVLRSDAYKKLTEVVNKLKANSKLKAIFSGHTDNAGNEIANDKRALERAVISADYVASFYIDRTRLLINSFGNKRPVADLNDPSVQWRNRRVEIRIFESKE
jgi:outer membrane protein OmpA-like peptidoglycan-associated protein